MQTHKIVLTICILLACSHAQSYGGVFAFSWLAGYCQDQVQNHREACDHNQVALWDSQSFTIHGLWADAASSTSFGGFNVAVLQKEIKLLDDMHNYWPPKAKVSTSNVFLWQHEWETHGKDYANILFKLKPENFPGTVDARNAALQLAFYKDIIVFYQRFKVKKLAAGTYTHSAIASAIGLAPNQFVMVCANSNIVREMQVCFDIVKTGINPKACTKTTNCAGGGQTIQLLDWKIKGQSRVTNYPASLTTQ